MHVYLYMYMVSFSLFNVKSSTGFALADDLTWFDLIDKPLNKGDGG